MATKILFSGNRIIFDGHADTAVECQSITAMCDSLAANENFKTVVYEKGHAVFERVSGGESEMFETQNWVLQDQYDSEVGANYPEAKGTIAYRLEALESVISQFEAQIAALTTLIGTLPEGIEATTVVGYVDEKTNVTEYQLPYTAEELVEILSKVGNSDSAVLSSAVGVSF